MKRILPILALAALLLAACGKPVATATPTPVPAAGVTLIYEDNAQFELVTPAGRHIYLDVVTPRLLVAEPTADDVLLTTHLHNDHYYKPFAEAFPGQQLRAEVGSIDLPDVTITGIAAGHNSADPIEDVGSTDYIYVVEIDGLRIADFGDIGQDALTADQLTALGTIDVAIMQFDNSFSNMSDANMKGFNLMDQVAPRLVIPTSHVARASIEIAVGRWTGYYSDSRAVTISKDGLPAGTSILILGNMATAYNSLYQLQLWK